MMDKTQRSAHFLYIFQLPGLEKISSEIHPRGSVVFCLIICHPGR